MTFASFVRAIAFRLMLLSSSRRLLLALLLWLALPCADFAQTAQFESLTIEQGLSQGMIFDILQTREGFLWVTTKDGLNRYDGYNFKVFSHDPFDAFSLADDHVEVLFEDSRGWMWVGTGSKGVDVYDPRTGLFHHINPDFPPAEQVVFTNPRTFLEGRDGSIWVQYHGRGLVRIEIPEHWRAGLPQESELGKLTKIAHCPMPDWDAGRERWVNMWLEADGRMTAFSSLQQYRVTSDMKAVAIGHRDLWPSLIYSAEPDERLGKDGFWLLGELGRLYSFRHGQLSFIPTPLDWENQQSSVQNDGKEDILLMFGDRVWRLDPQRHLDWDKPLWVLDRDVKSVCTDRNGNFWVGTAGYGLRRFNPRFEAFRTGVAGQSIWRLWCSPAGRYFWRNASDIYEYDPLTGKSAASQAFPELAGYWVRDMVFEPSGAFWLLAAHRSNGNQMHLCRYGPTCKLEQRQAYPILDYSYACLLRARNGALWINGDECQLTKLDPSSGQTAQYSYAHLFGEKAPTTQAFAIAEDGNGTLWIGTQQGLVRATPAGQNMDFHLFQAEKAHPEGLNHNNVSALLPDPVRPQAILWVGTKGGGLNQLDLRSGRFHHYGLKDGLPDKVVYGILPGNEDPRKGPVSLWCSTNQGLAKLIPLTPMPQNGDKIRFETVVFTAAKGLQDNEFNTQSFFKSAQGELLFGGINGLNHFFPERLRSDTALPSVFVVGLEINHLPAAPEHFRGSAARSLEFLRVLRLPYDQNNVSFEFAALDFTDPSKNRYRYRLVGIDADWVETGNDRFAHFTHLAPGRYEFRVQGSNGEGEWQEASNPIIVVIDPPWWRSNWAYLCYVLLLAWGLWQAYQFQIRRVKLREQLAFEHREMERVKALEQLKTNFFSNVTHEFRTPLTLILEPLRQLIKNPGDPARAEKIRLAEKNSRQLLDLVNQLLDMAKLEAGQMTLDLRKGNLQDTVRDVFETFLPLAEKRGIKLNYKQNVQDSLDFEFDASKVKLVLNNLISNALKFTPEGGRVNVELKIENGEFRMENGEWSPLHSPFSILHSKFSIRVSDSGVGIQPDLLDKIFDRFYQVDGSNMRKEEGTGIGLALSKELAELMGGGIAVTSEVGKGSTFTFWIPASPSAPFSKKGEGGGGAPIASPFLEKGSEGEAVFPSPSLEKALGGAAIALVIEDNPDLRHFIKDSIAPNWQVVEASNGDEGIAKALEILPDIVITDLMMPGKDGFAVCDTLKNNELTAHIPIVMLTAKSGMDTKLKGLHRGADDYLTKPFNTEELTTRMDNLVNMRRRLRELFGQQASALAALAQQENALPGGGLLSVPDRDFLQKFILTLEKNLGDTTLGVEDFAGKMQINRVQLHRKLKALTDRSATDFIRDYRLDRAHAMLKNREGMVHDIASRVGFGDEKYFSRAFKEKFGTSPSQVM